MRYAVIDGNINNNFKRGMERNECEVVIAPDGIEVQVGDLVIAENDFTKEQRVGKIKAIAILTDETIAFIDELVGYECECGILTISHRFVKEEDKQ